MLAYLFVELHEIVNIFTYYAFSLVLTEQFTDERAGKITNEIFLDYSINFIKERFDKAVACGMCKQFNTEFVATQFMHIVLFGITQRAHEDMGHKPAYDVNKMFQDLEQNIYLLVTGESL